MFANRPGPGAASPNKRKRTANTNMFANCSRTLSRTSYTVILYFIYYEYLFINIIVGWGYYRNIETHLTLHVTAVSVIEFGFPIVIAYLHTLFTRTELSAPRSLIMLLLMQPLIDDQATTLTNGRGCTALHVRASNPLRLVTGRRGGGGS